MTIKLPQEIDVPDLALRYCTADEYCKVLQKMEGIGYWWYLDPANKQHTYSRPFLSSEAVWWYHIKPGLAWPADILTPLEKTALTFRQRYLGCQYRTEDLRSQNSRLVFNVIEDVKHYSASSIDDKRRAAVRKGLRLCVLQIVDGFEKEIFSASLKAWNQLVTRTGWKQKLTGPLFEESWKKLLDLPGCTLMAGIDRQTGMVAGFLIGKVIERTAYIDTIASADMTAHLNVNDLLVYSFLTNAKKIADVQYFHYGLASSVADLEKFKRSFGFKAKRYPATTILTPGVGFFLEKFFPQKYSRLLGNI